MVLNYRKIKDFVLNQQYLYLLYLDLNRFRNDLKSRIQIRNKYGSPGSQTLVISRVADPDLSDPIFVSFLYKIQMIMTLEQIT